MRSREDYSAALLKRGIHSHTYAKVCSGKNNKVEINFHQNFRANDLTNEAVCQLKKYLPKVCNSKSI